MSSTNSPASQLITITPSDTVPLAGGVRAIWVGGAGDVAVVGLGDLTPKTLIGAQAGQVIPVFAKFVYATGTTATNLIGLI